MLEPVFNYPQHPRSRTLAIIICLAMALSFGALIPQVFVEQAQSAQPEFSPSKGHNVQLVSVGRDGEPADGRSLFPDIDDSGSTIVFTSGASNIDDSDNNVACGAEGERNCLDLFVYDVKAGSARVVSRAGGGTGDQASEGVTGGGISADGLTVGFKTESAIFSPDDDNGVLDDYLVDLESGNMELLSRDQSGAPQRGDIEPFCKPGCGTVSLSGHGRFAVFSTVANDIVTGDQNGLLDAFLVDRKTGIITWVSNPNTSGLIAGQAVASGTSSISDDGHYVVFSAETILNEPEQREWCDSDDGTGEAPWQIFLYDVKKQVSEILSIDVSGVPGCGHSGRPVISGDGSTVFFHSRAPRLTADDSDEGLDVFQWTRDTATLKLVSTLKDAPDSEALAMRPTTNRDGSTVVFVTNREAYGAKGGIHGLVVSNPATSAWEPLALSSDGTWPDDHLGRAALNGAGNLIVFFGAASNLANGPGYEGDDGADVFLATNPLLSRAANDAALGGRHNGPSPTIPSTTWASALLATGMLVAGCRNWLYRSKE